PCRALRHRRGMRSRPRAARAGRRLARTARGGGRRLDGRRNHGRDERMTTTVQEQQATPAQAGTRGTERLRFENVTKRFPPRPGSRGGTVVAVEGVDFAIADREVVSLIGPSGCGKSTLLHMASGL